jgi:hypothetical protein
LEVTNSFPAVINEEYDEEETLEYENAMIN